MEFIHQYKKILFVSLGISLLVILILLYVFTRTSAPPNNTNNLSPTISSPEETTITLEPAVQTGARDDNPTAEELEKTNQAFELRNRLPFDGGTFFLSYNYTDDVFEVKLSEPKEQSREIFTSWLQTNYPTIGLTRFVVVE